MSAPEHEEHEARTIIVLSDAAGREHGARLAAELEAAGYRVEHVARPEIPIGDGLPATLHGIASRCDAAIGVVSSSPRARSWLRRELAMEGLYPTWLVAVAPGWPEWAEHLDASSPRVLGPGDGVVTRMRAWFTAARPHPP